MPERRIDPGHGGPGPAVYVVAGDRSARARARRALEELGRPVRVADPASGLEADAEAIALAERLRGPAADVVVVIVSRATAAPAAPTPAAPTPAEPSPGGPPGSRRDAARRRLDRLTGPQRQVLELALTGAITKEIAARLRVSLRTAERRRAEALAVLEVASAVEAATVFADAR